MVSQEKTYDERTINARNPLVRFAHRNRLKRSISFARYYSKGGAVLDYGCGTGAFVSEMRRLAQLAIGYEPYMDSTKEDCEAVFRNFGDIEKRGPFNLVTLFEVIEHLTDWEHAEFLHRVRGILRADGAVLYSAPIEIGPCLFLKEMSRTLAAPHKWDYNLRELLLAGSLGIPASRAPNIKISHKGFDFRRALRFIERYDYSVQIIGFGPLPIRTWYGNSQVFFTARPLGRMATSLPH